MKNISGKIDMIKLSIAFAIQLAIDVHRILREEAQTQAVL